MLRIDQSAGAIILYGMNESITFTLIQPGVRVPAVLATCWRSPQDIPGCLLINMSERPQRVSLDWSSLLKSWGNRGCK